MKRETITNPRITARQMKQAHPNLLGDVDNVRFRSSAKNTLASRSATPTKVPLLTRHMRRARLDFASQHKHWTAEDRTKVLWSNKSSFRCWAKRYKEFRRPSNISPFDTRNLHTSVKHSDSVMVWGAFSGAMGRDVLYVLPKAHNERCLFTCTKGNSFYPTTIHSVTSSRRS